MKALRILEVVTVPLVLGYAGSQAVLFTSWLLHLQGRTYGLTRINEPITPIIVTAASAFLAGIGAVLLEWKNPAPRRWRFYAQVAATLLVSVALVFAIENLRPRGENLARTLGAIQHSSFSSIPFWVLSAGFAAPFAAQAWKKIRT